MCYDEDEDRIGATLLNRSSTWNQQRIDILGPDFDSQ